MHFDGANGGTTFTDVHGHAFTIQAGSPVTDTSSFKFATASLSTPPSSAIQTAASTDWVFTGDFTVDAWFETPDTTTTRRPLGIIAGGGGWQLHLSSDGNFYIYDGNNYKQIALIPATNAFFHVAWCRVGTSNYGFVNGTLGLTWTKSGNIGANSILTIGHVLGETEYAPNMHIDELRIINGTGVWTTNFTPPTSPYTM